MSRRRKVYGRCHLCGLKRELTFEHIPPQSAFNDHKVLYNDVQTLLLQGMPEPFKGKQQQGGIGRNTLCSSCNSFTGVEYGAQYVAWAAQGMEVVLRTRISPLIEMPFHILPLHVIKQIVSLFLSINSLSWRDGNPDLVEFVCWPTRKHLDPKYSIYAFYSVSAMQRQAGTTVMAKITDTFENLGVHAFSEITFPPFGYVMMVQSKSVDRRPHDKRLVDISYFANYAYRQYHPVYLKLPVLPIHTYLPGDYRTKEQVARDVQENKRKAQEMANMAFQAIGDKPPRPER